MRHPRIYVGFVAAALLAGGCYNALTSSGPVKVYDGAQYRDVHVLGTEVYLHAAAERSRPACFGAYANRQMVTYWDAEHKQRNESRAIRETGLVDSDTDGWRDEHPIFHLYSPLPSTGADWFLIAEFHDNCPVLFRFLPDAAVAWLLRHGIGDRVFHSPPTRVAFGAPPPEIYQAKPAKR